MIDKTISPLRQRMIEDMTVRHFKEKVQKDYIRHVKNFTVFLGRSPNTATSEDLRLFQLHMTRNQVSAASVAEACTAAGESLVEQLAASASEKSPQRGFNTIVENYLSAAHRDEPADGCPIAALGSEIARSDERTRAAATQALMKFVEVIASQSGKTRPDVAQRGALVAAALMIGVLTMSRVVTDPELSAEILREAENQLVNSR